MLFLCIEIITNWINKFDILREIHPIFLIIYFSPSLGIFLSLALALSPFFFQFFKTKKKLTKTTKQIRIRRSKAFILLFFSHWSWLFRVCVCFRCSFISFFTFISLDKVLFITALYTAFSNRHFYASSNANRLGLFWTNQNKINQVASHL